MREGCHAWLRLDLPSTERERIEESARDLGLEFFQGKDAEIDPQRLQQISAVYTEEPLPDELVERMPCLEWVQVTRGGIYPYLSPSIKRRPIQVTGSRGIHGQAFSEFALAAIFALAKELPTVWRAQQAREWQRIFPSEVNGKTLGILGLGVVGSEVARKAKLLGMRVLATKRQVGSRPPGVDELYPPEGLTELLPQADFVVITLPSIPSTEGVLGERELRSMRRSAHLINLTTAKAVEEDLLVRALREAWIAGAALDALPRQPLPKTSELWTLPNVIVSPRIAGLSAHRWDLLVPIFLNNLRRFVENRPLINVANKELGY